MHRNLVHFALIGLMVLLGISILTFSVLTSRQTKQNETEHSKDKPQKLQLNERHLPKIEPKVDEERKGSEESLESAFQGDFSKDAMPEEQKIAPPTLQSLPSEKSDEDKVIVRIKELEAQLADYKQQFHEFDKQKKEIDEQMNFLDTEGAEKLIGELKELEKLKRNNILTEHDVAELTRQKANDFNQERLQLAKLEDELLKQMGAIAREMASIHRELNSLKNRKQL